MKSISLSQRLNIQLPFGLTLKMCSYLDIENLIGIISQKNKFIIAFNTYRILI